MIILSWLRDHPAEALMALVAFLQVELLRKQYRLSHYLIARELKVTEEILDKNMKRSRPRWFSWCRKRR